ncbi:MAG TPA: hypothetical protein VFX16_21495 [Pseudonocardiaceae bacterium]|nr:hypothetical protein [Pseudonocardiaceae bacterium]
MWIFGQVWFACLVGFAVGVVLDWVVRVRPLSQRVASLEARLAGDARSARQDGEHGRSVFDRGPFASATLSPDGFVTERNRGGLLTPKGTGGVPDSFETDLLDIGEPPPHDAGRTGVEDFPGVSRISDAWETEAEEATRAAPEPWQPIGPAATAAEESWQADEPALSALESTRDNWQTQPNQPAEPVDDTEAADQQYLEFLRAGANHAPIDAGADDDDTDDTETHGEVPPPDANEVTSVLPYAAGDAIDADGEQPRIDGYEAYESYAQDEYQQNGYQAAEYQGNGYADSGYQFGEYQPEEIEEPEESSSPLPRRGASSEGSLRFTPFAPYEIPFEGQDAEYTDTQQPHNGELTPIEEGGFQPFQKPVGAADGPYDTATDGAWIGEDGQLVGLMQDGLQDVSANGSHMLSEADEASPSSWFDFSDAGPQTITDGSLTQRMLPVSRPDLDHPDLLPESVFGTDNDTIYGEDGPARSLFEPVIPPDELEDNFQAPAYEEPAAQPAYVDQQPAARDEFDGFEDVGYDTPGYGDAAFDTTPQGTPETASDSGPATDEFFSPAASPRPMRVRTGMDSGPATQSIPAMPSVPTPGHADGDGGDQGGPFGPGSALPLPDGSAPSPQFRVKARTSSMVFHTEASPFYERLEPQVWFHDPGVAQRAGFTSWERPRTW